MRSTRQFSITLPNEMADAVRTRVEAGAYATESEVIRDGLRALFARERAMEAWLRTDVVASARELDRAPGRALSLEAVRNHLGGDRPPPAAAKRRKPG